MSKPSAPPPPDPKATSAAQTGTNIGTAVANAIMGGVNQVGPEGSKTRTQTGSYNYVDPYTGKSYDIPTFTETTSLSPEQQKLYDLNTKTQAQLGQVGLDQSLKIGSLLGTNVNLDTATEDKIVKLGAARLDPQFARDQSALEAKLANQGIQPGSAAWNAQMTQFQQGKNDAYSSLYLNGRAQGAQEALAERNQPINEITALLSGSQVSQPNFSPVNMPTIPTTDNAGLINQNFQQQNQNYQNQMTNYNQIMGGLFGLGSAGVFKYSDRRLKYNITHVGYSLNGLPLYLYRMKDTDELQVGLMADEVEAVKPDAVRTINGFKAVDYGLALEAA